MRGLFGLNAVATLRRSRRSRRCLAEALQLMTRARIVEILAIVLIAILVASGGRLVLYTMGHYKLWGIAASAGFLYLALRGLKTAYDPSNPDARVNVTKAGAYVCAAALVLWAVAAPAPWVYGSCIVAVEVALVFDLINIVAQSRVRGGN
jgi:hypothetical protein